MFGKKKSKPVFTHQRQKMWHSPGGESPGYYIDLLDEPHILIAGATGSGKSVFINSLMATLITDKTPAHAELVLIDPKRVELFPLRVLPHCSFYANDTLSAVNALNYTVDRMMKRYDEMAYQGLKKYQGGHIYVVIDEYADLMVTARKSVEPLITRLIQLGRAANVHLIVATQRPTSEVISGAIRVNLDCKIALHTATAQDSRNIIGQAGAETLPRVGYCYMLSPEGLTAHRVIPWDDRLPALIRYWTGPNCIVEM